MSEAERKKRLSYKENRKRWIFIQGVALIVVAVLIFASVITYSQLNKESYINYTESSGVDYKVRIKPGTPFYEEYKDYYANENGEVWLNAGEAYPATAVDIIIADVNYELNMEARDVDYEYSYSVFATAEVVDSVTKNKFNMPVVEIKAKSTHRQNSNNKLFIHEEVPVDYNAYNEMVKKFTKQLGITKSASTLIVTMEVSVVSSSSDFASNSKNRHVVNISVPLTEQSFKVDYSSSIPSGESKVLAYKNAGNQQLYKGAAITLGAIELLLFVVFISFVYLTRNHDVNYSIKVQRLVNSYRSFIQKVTNGFDATGYQILEIASFREMLSIRDTIQSPVLMSENTDQTRTQFFIPTNTKILYLFEVKVENYDELYGYHPDWIDDSLISTEKCSPENEDTETAIPLAEEPSATKPTDELVLKLFAEIESLKKNMQAPDPAEASASLPKSQCTPAASCFGGGEAKIGNFSAQGNVIINYNEQPSENVVTEAIKKLTETIMQVNKEDAAKDSTPLADNASTKEGEATEQEVCNTSIEGVAEENTEIITEEPLEEVAEEPIEEAAEETVEEVVEEAADEVAPETEETVEDLLTVENEAAVGCDEKTAEQAQQTEVVTENNHLDLEHILNDLEYDEAHGYFLDENGAAINIQCRRSFTANIIQSDPGTVKYYYSELKNYALSFKGVKAKMSWRYETFKKGRNQLLRMKIRGKCICLYCALDPAQFDKSKYFQEAIDAKMFESVPMLVKIKSPRGLKRAMELIDATMEKFGIEKDSQAKNVDYVALYPFENTKALVEKGLIMILDSNYIIKDSVIHSKPETAERPDVIEEENNAAPTFAQELEAMLEPVDTNAVQPNSTEDTAADISISDLEFDEAGEIIIPDGNKLEIHCKRSLVANIMQSDPHVAKLFYSEIKNYILSFKGVKARMAWRYESYNKGRNQLFRIRLKGKSVCLYCALDPGEVDESRYFHDVATAKNYSDVPTMVKIKTSRGLKRAMELVDAVMNKFDIQKNPKAQTVDYLEVYPFKTTAELVAIGQVKILSDAYKIKEPKAPQMTAAKK